MIHSNFSTRKPVRSENYRHVGHAIDRLVDVIAGRFSRSTLLNRGCGSLFELRYARENVLSRENMAPSLAGDSDL